MRNFGSPTIYDDLCTPGLLSKFLNGYPLHFWVSIATDREGQNCDRSLANGDFYSGDELTIYHNLDDRFYGHRPTYSCPP